MRTQQGRTPKRRPFPCDQCGGEATWDAEWGHYRCGGCSYFWSEDEAPRRHDGRIRGPEDVAPRIAGARARRGADPVLGGRALLRELHELYCETAERHSWVEVMAADSWAEEELTRRLGRRVHRTQVRRARLALEGLGYVRRVTAPRGFPLRELVATYKLEGRRPPIIVEVLKAKEAE